MQSVGRRCRRWEVGPGPPGARPAGGGDGCLSSLLSGLGRGAHRVPPAARRPLGAVAGGVRGRPARTVRPCQRPHPWRQEGGARLMARRLAGRLAGDGEVMWGGPRRRRGRGRGWGGRRPRVVLRHGGAASPRAGRRPAVSLPVPREGRR